METNNKTLEFFSDSLSDISDDDYSSESDFNFYDDSSSEEEELTSTRKCKRQKMNDLNTDRSNDENVKLPKIETFQGDPGIKIHPHSKDISDVVELFIGDDFIQHLCDQSNLYRYQNRTKLNDNTLKFIDISSAQMRKFLAIIIMMGHIKKDNIRDYWTTDPLFETKIFGKLMSRDRFLQIWKCWHFNDNANQLNESSTRLFKVEPIINYIKKACIHVYTPKQQLSLTEAIIPWKGRLKFASYDPKLYVNNGLIIRMVTEADTGYICNFDICSEANKKNSNETIFSILSPYLDVEYHIYQNIHCNNIEIAEQLLHRKTRVCGIVRQNDDKNIPITLMDEIKTMKEGEHIYHRKNDVLIQLWKNKKINKMISTIHDSKMASTTTNKYDKNVCAKPNCILDFNKYMRRVERVEQYFSYCGVLRNTNKWSKKLVLFIINCALFNSYRLYLTINNNMQLSYKTFLKEVARIWSTEQQIIIMNNTTKNAVATTSQHRPVPLLPPTILPSQPQPPSPPSTPSTPSPQAQVTTVIRRSFKQDHPERLSGDMKKHFLTKIVTNGIKKNPQRACRVCSAHKIRRDTSYMCNFCEIPLHKGDCFQIYHTLENYC